MIIMTIIQIENHLNLLLNHPGNESHQLNHLHPVVVVKYVTNIDVIVGKHLEKVVLLRIIPVTIIAVAVVVKMIHKSNTPLTIRTPPDVIKRKKWMY